MQKQIDVVIPSYRLNEKILLDIFSLPVPVGTSVCFFLIADNPDVAVPSVIEDLADKKAIKLLVNETNFGFSKTRNKGIQAGKSPWILLLDDDVVPDRLLLHAYSKAIDQSPDSAGFIGVTDFPEPFNAVTRAIELNGATTHFKAARDHDELTWAPTANIVLSRRYLGNKEFDPELVNGGEDIELLTRIAFEHNTKFRGVADALVVHPWWNKGRAQLKRMLQYGKGSADIVNKKHIAPYTYYDFTNTSETILVLLICAVISAIARAGSKIYLLLIATIVVAELLTNIVRAVVLSGYFSLPLAWQMLLHKNATEAGALLQHIRKGRLLSIGKRLDAGFSKKNPSPFRLNRWKIIKLITIALLITLVQCLHLQDKL